MDDDVIHKAVFRHVDMSFTGKTTYKLNTLLFPFQGIEDLCTKRDELQKQILNEEEEKSKIQNDIRILSERLAKINESLAKKIASRNEYDKTIAETEAAYMKVGLNFLQRLKVLNLFACRCYLNCHHNYSLERAYGGNCQTT